MTDIVQQIYAMEAMNNEEENQKTMSPLPPLQDFIKARLGWKRKDMEGLFTKQNLHLLESDVMLSTFDITIAYKILPKLFPRVFEELSDECKRSMEYIKTMRNKLAHVMDPDTNIDTKKEISLLKMKYDEIYLGVSNVIGYDFTQRRQIMKEMLSNMTIFKASDYEHYQQELIEFEKDVSHKLLREGRKELKEYYERLRVVNPCTWLLQDDIKSKQYSVSKHYIEKIYTPLQIKTLSGGEEQRLDTKNILTKTKTKFTTDIRGRNHNPDDEVDEHILPNGLLLNGLAGCGKTSLCRFILHEWRTDGDKINGLKDFDLVILVEARSIQQTTLKQLLTEHIFPKTIKTLKQRIKTLYLMGESVEDDIIPAFLDMSILFIIDGFDEASRNTKKVIRNIFGTFNKSLDHRIIVTTRPEFLEEIGNYLNISNFEYITAKICGFDDEGIRTFTHNVFDVALCNEAKEKNVDVEEYSRRKSEEFRHYIEGRGRILNNQLYLPLTLALLIHLWIDNKDKLNRVTNCTSLYYELFSLCQDKVRERLRLQETCTDRQTITDILLFIGKVSWELLQVDTISLKNAEIKRIEEECKKKGVNEVEIMSAFLACEYDENQDTKEDRNYSFLHKTQMEYLAAQYIAERIKMGGLGEVPILDSWQGFHQVIVFLVGHLLSQSKSKETNVTDTTRLLFELVDKANIHETNFEFWWKFLVESGEHKKKAGMRIAQERLPETSWELKYDANNDNLVSGLELLCNIPVRLESLRIEVPNGKDPYDIKDMYGLMTELNKHLKRQYNKNNPLLTELHFWQHYNKTCKKHTDDWVRTLRPWGHLTNLTGSLGEQRKGQELLNYCFKLKTIRVRLCTLKAVESLATSLLKIYRTVRKLRLSLVMSPDSVDPVSFPSVTSKGDLDIHIPGMKDNNKDWVVEAVISLSRGCV